MLKVMVVVVVLMGGMMVFVVVDWIEIFLLDYIDFVSFVVVGGDGVFYLVSFNLNGYVFILVLDKFWFELILGDGFFGCILGGKEIIYFGFGCDVFVMGEVGVWINDSIGLNFRFDMVGG